MSHSELPATSDFYALESTLPDRDRALLAQVRTFMREEVAPIINDYWSREEFPHQVFPRMAELGMGGMALAGYGCADRGVLVDGFVAMEMAAVDCSVATGLGVHNHLAMGSIHHCGSEEQKQAWLPRMAALEAIGAFGLTEPEVGSGVARGLQTTARRDGDLWVPNGAKRWIGNATFADVTVIWARDEADNKVKGFLVEKGTPGFVGDQDDAEDRVARGAERRHRPHRCRGPRDGTANANTFMDTAGVLTQSRIAVAWEAVGCARGA